MKEYHCKVRVCIYKYQGTRSATHWESTPLNSRLQYDNDAFSPVRTKHGCCSPALSIGIDCLPRGKHCTPRVSKSQRTMVQPVLSAVRVNSAVNPVTDVHWSSKGSSSSPKCMIFHSRPASLVLAWPFCDKLYGPHTMSCGMKSQLGTLVLQLPDSEDSEFKISWHHGAWQETSSLEFFIASLRDDSWAFQDLKDRVSLTTVTVKKH